MFVFVSCLATVWAQEPSPLAAPEPSPLEAALLSVQQGTGDAALSRAITDLRRTLEMNARMDDKQLLLDAMISRAYPWVPPPQGPPPDVVEAAPEEPAESMEPVEPSVEPAPVAVTGPLAIGVTVDDASTTSEATLAPPAPTRPAPVMPTELETSTVVPAPVPLTPREYRQKRRAARRAERAR